MNTEQNQEACKCGVEHKPIELITNILKKYEDTLFPDGFIEGLGDEIIQQLIWSLALGKSHEVTIKLNLTKNNDTLDNIEVSSGVPDGTTKTGSELWMACANQIMHLEHTQLVANERTESAGRMRKSFLKDLANGTLPDVIERIFEAKKPDAPEDSQEQEAA